MPPLVPLLLLLVVLLVLLLLTCGTAAGGSGANGQRRELDAVQLGQRRRHRQVILNHQQGQLSRQVAGDLGNGWTAPSHDVERCLTARQITVQR